MPVITAPEPKIDISTPYGLPVAELNMILNVHIRAQNANAFAIPSCFPASEAARGLIDIFLGKGFLDFVLDGRQP